MPLTLTPQNNENQKGFTFQCEIYPIRPWFEAQSAILVSSNNFSTAMGILFDENQLPEGLEKDVIYFYHEQLLSLQQVHKTIVWSVWEKDRWLEHVASIPLVEYVETVAKLENKVSLQPTESVIYTPQG